MEKRTNIRIPLITSGKIATLLSDESGIVYTANISRQGLCFFSKTSLPLEAEVVLELELSHPNEPMVTEYLHGRILWKRDWGELTAHGVLLSLPLSPEKTPRLLRLTAGFQIPAPFHESVKHPEVHSKEPLTERECEIARLIAQGYNNREMAQRLAISVKTVETHRANIYSKLKVHNAVQLLRALEASGAWVVNHDQINIE